MTLGMAQQTRTCWPSDLDMTIENKVVDISLTFIYIAGKKDGTSCNAYEKRQ
jgi:hypothetical protein